jgi:FkbM family methyltransferase
MVSRFVTSVRAALYELGHEISKRNGVVGTWIDVGAFEGKHTLPYAQANPGLRVFALEPDPSIAAKLIGAASNFFVVPIAIAEEDGTADFYVNKFRASSSLLPLNPVGVRQWVGGELLKVEKTITVPTMRLDTFMNMVGIKFVDFLKIDAQGMDLAVVKSAGGRLLDIEKIMLEVCITKENVYSGAHSKDEVVAFLDGAGFRLVDAQQQTQGQEENLTFVRRNSGAAERTQGDD